MDKFDLDKLESNTRADYIKMGQSLLVMDITPEERKNVELAIKWLRNPKSSSEKVVISTSIIKILFNQYNMEKIRNKKVKF